MYHVLSPSYIQTTLNQAFSDPYMIHKASNSVNVTKFLVDGESENERTLTSRSKHLLVSVSAATRGSSTLVSVLRFGNASGTTNHAVVVLSISCHNPNTVFLQLSSLSDIHPESLSLI